MVERLDNLYDEVVEERGLSRQILEGLAGKAGRYAYNSLTGGDWDTSVLGKSTALVTKGNYKGLASYLGSVAWDSFYTQATGQSFETSWAGKGYDYVSGLLRDAELALSDRTDWYRTASSQELQGLARSGRNILGYTKHSGEVLINGNLGGALLDRTRLHELRHLRRSKRGEQNHSELQIELEVDYALKMYSMLNRGDHEKAIAAREIGKVLHKIGEKEGDYTSTAFNKAVANLN